MLAPRIGPRSGAAIAYPRGMVFAISSRRAGVALVVGLQCAGCRPGQPSATPAVEETQPAAAAPEATQPVVAAPEETQPAAPEAAPAVEPTPVVSRTIAVGKWPEGVAVVGGAAWVAESGERRVARLDLARGEPGEPIAVGRLPTSVAIGPDGAVYVLVATDGVIKVIRPGRKQAELLARVPSYAEDMVLAEGALWVLLWAGRGQGKGGSVLRVDLATRKQTRSGSVGDDSPSAIAMGHGKVWVVVRDSAAPLTVLDAASWERGPVVAAGRSGTKVLAGATAVYLGTEETLERIDPVSLQVTHSIATGQRISALAGVGDVVVAACGNGDLWVLGADDLSLRKIWRPGGGGHARGLAISGADIVWTRHEGATGEAGALHIISIE